MSIDPSIPLVSPHNMAKSKRVPQGKPKPSVIVPQFRSKNASTAVNSDIPSSVTSSSPSPITPVTPKTPADEGIDFFQSNLNVGESPIRVYELHLGPDGGPDKDRTVNIILHIQGMETTFSSTTAL
jgi:glycogen debranching enzyme